MLGTRPEALGAGSTVLRASCRGLGLKGRVAVQGLVLNLDAPLGVIDEKPVEGGLSCSC